MSVDIYYWLPVLFIAGYLPFLILLDLKYRQIPHTVWIGMAPLLLLTGLAYYNGYYPSDCMWISFAAVVVWFVAMKSRLFEGADFILLSCISLFFVVNPVSGRVLMPLVLAEMLVASMVSVSCIAFIMGRKYREFPMILIISIAFVLAVILG